MEKRIKREYKKASVEVERKAASYFKQFDAADKKMVSRLKHGEITRKEYNAWRQSQMMSGARWAAMRDSLARDFVDVDTIAADIINDKLIDVYALNYNYATYSVHKAINLNLSFTLYDRHTVMRLLRTREAVLPKAKMSIPKDLRWNMEKIQSAITQGVLQGDSMPEIAKRLRGVARMDQNAALRNARTLVTGAENAGRLDSYYRAKRMGIDLKKVWLASLDNVTRDSHVDLDGEEQDVDKPFSNGMDYPGGMGPPEEVYNCRCCMVAQIKGFETDFSDVSWRNTDKMGNMTYEEWKEHKRKR